MDEVLGNFFFFMSERDSPWIHSYQWSISPIHLKLLYLQYNFVCIAIVRSN